MGDICSVVVGTMLELLYRSIGRQFGYLVHCKKNIKDFADEVDKLSLTKARVQVKVDAAESNAEVLHDDVLEWRRKVQSMEDDKSRLLQSKDNLKCLDVCSRYRLGKEGKKKKPDVAQLIVEGNNFGDVGYQRPPTVTFQKTYSMNYESFQSREFVFEEIMKALKDDGTYKIGIHGMPGVGKTRMMEQVAQQAHRESLFDEVTQIVVSQNPILEDIQQKLAKSLNMKEPENASKKQICDRLRNGKRILIMVDDVWNNEIKLEEIGIPAADNRTKGCKIFLTSRRKEVCLQMAEKEFEIGVLSEDEALDLFEKTVGDFTEHPELHSIAKEVCSECDLLPLAIVTVGKALQYQKEKMHAWNTALHQLKHSMGYNIPGVSKKVYSCIELSYQYLKLKDPMLEDLQPCFLHCCLFPEDAEICIDDLVKYAVGTRFLEGTNRESMEIARDRTRMLIDILKESNLLLNGRGENFVKMHDVIRDVAISIASKEKDAMFLVKAGVEKWPDEDAYKQCKAISLRFNDACVLPDDSECTEVCTLMLEFRNLSSEVPSSFFKGMKKLEVLQLRNMQISELPSSLKNLRMLCLYNCKLVNVTFRKIFKKLEILCIQDSDLRELAPEIGQLTRLRLLDVRYCDKLKIIPSGVISSLSQLEELYIPNEFGQWAVSGNASLNELNSLKHIRSLQVFVPNVMLLPFIEPLFKSLYRFQISIGSNLHFWEQRSSATRILKVVGFPLKKELDILMKKVEVLYLKDLKENVPNGLCGSVLFHELSLLEVVNCKSMIYLFSSVVARSLSRLQELTISGCEIMEEIVRDDQEVMDGVIIFHHLKKIELKYLPKLRSFYASMKKSTIRECNTSTLVQALFNDKVSLPALEKLTIEDLESLTAIWVDQSQPLEQVKEAEDSFRRLTDMIVRKCEKLVNVIPSCMLPRLQNLKQLQVGKCDSLFSEVVEVHGSVEKGSPTVEPTIDVLPGLQEMLLTDLPNLVMYMTLNRKEHFAGGICAYSNLTDLHLSKRDNLKNVFSPSTARYLVHLQKLEVCRCEKMEEIVAIERGELEKVGKEDLVHDEIIVFPQLKHLELKNLPNLKSFCCCTSGSKKREEETVELNISQVEALFNHKVAFPALEELEIRELESLTAIWEGQSQSLQVKEAQNSFQSLRSMEVWECHKLVNVIASNVLPSLQKLEKLFVYRCYSVEGIVEVERGQLGEEDVVHDEIVVFSQLKYLKLIGLPNLTSFTHESKEEGETVDQIIPRVEALFNHKVAFPALEELYIIKLESLTAIWEGQSQSLQVKEAQISFQSLRSMHVCECHKLVNVIASNVLPSLQKLEKLGVSECDSVEEIVAVERGQLEKEDIVHDEIIVFPQLKYLKLKHLKNLKSFTLGSKEYEETVDQIIPRVEALFNHKVAFPVLEELDIGRLESLTAIWEGQSQSLIVKEAQVSFQSLRSMDVWNCDKLVNVIASNVLPSLQKLEILKVSKCDSVKEIFAVERGQLGEKDGVHDEIIVFPQLKYLELEELPRVETLFNHKVSFPALKKLKITKLQSLAVIWDNQLFLDLRAQVSQLRFVIVQGCEKLVNVIPPNAFPTGLMVFHSLKYLILSKCNSLRYVFSFSIARGLTQLRGLGVVGCSVMEEIVGSEGEGEEDYMDEIVFSQLKYLCLEGLPNLTCFCGTNNAFKFPSLKWVGLGKCPQLQTFTTGCLSTPNKLTIDYGVGECNDVIDLNDYVQQFVRREKGLAVGESPGDDEDDDDLNDYVQQFVRREKGLAVDESEDDDEDYDFGDDDDDYDCDDDLDGFMLGMVRRMMYGRRRRRRNKSW